MLFTELEYQICFILC